MDGGTGRRILDGLREAVRGDITRVTIEGKVWEQIPTGPQAELAAFRRFRNAIKIMRSIDEHELVDAGVDGVRWPDFRDKPYRTFLAASDSDQWKIWKIIEGRQK